MERNRLRKDSLAQLSASKAFCFGLDRSTRPTIKSRHFVGLYRIGAIADWLRGKDDMDRNYSVVHQDFWSFEFVFRRLMRTRIMMKTKRSFA